MPSATKAHALLALAILVAACDADCPTFPTPVQPAAAPVSPPGPPAITYHVSGLVVDEDGFPVASAFVSADRWSTVTDTNGGYVLTLELRQPVATFTVSKAAYETGRHAVFLTADRPTARDLRLHSILRITAGESLSISLDWSDPQCTFELIPCRRVRVRSPSQGTLRLDLAPDSGGHFSILAADEDLLPSNFTRLSFSVLALAGAETAFDIVSTTAARGGTLTTALDSP